jgi:hypothetical protein
MHQETEGCHFNIFKTGDKAYRMQFFQQDHQQYGTCV